MMGGLAGAYVKVFLSHSTKDKAFVEALAETLRTEGFEPWLCEVDILLGDDFVVEIEKGLREADLALLIWSPEAANSAWTGKEWRSVLAREIEESRTRLGLVLLKEAEIPELLRTKHRLDARPDPDKALQHIVQWLIRQRDMRVFEETAAARFVVDYEPTDFVGRTVYLEQLHTDLVAGRGKFLLWGEPGSGKSMLALKFAWRAQGAFDAVVFQHCGQRPVEEIGVELAQRVGLEVKELPPDTQIAQAKQWLCARRSLLVLDDIWNIDIKALIPDPPLSVSALSVLCTSRQRALPWVKRPRTLEVKSFVASEAESLFRLWLGEETVLKHRESLQAFAERVERLPIAVAVAAEMLSRQFGPLDEAARVLELERLRNEIHDVPDLLQRAIDTQAEREQRLLQAMAVCHPDGFWFPLAGRIADLDDTQSAQARDRLVNGSLMRLVDRERQRFRLHGLLREQLLKCAPLEALRNRHAEALEALFADWEHHWRECRECLPEVISAINVLGDQGAVSRMQWLAYEGFATGRRVGELEAALRILREEEELSRRLEGRDAKDSLQRSYGNQALILQAWGRLEEAIALLKKKEALCVELGLRSSLGYCYWNWGLLAREQNDRRTEREKLQAALQIFTELNMPSEQSAVQKELERMDRAPEADAVEASSERPEE